MLPFLEKLRGRATGVTKAAITLAAAGLAIWLGLRIHGLFTESPTLVGGQGAGTASAPYSDALGPWLHGSLSYWLRGVPLTYLYRPTIGLFFSAIITITNSISAVPVVWIVLSFLLGGALFALDGWSHRLAFAGVLGVMVIFFPTLIRPLNPETLMADFWPMVMGLAGIWLIARSEGEGSFSLPGAAAGFLLLGIAACVRGPQLASGAALLAWLAPGWLKRRRWGALLLLPVIFAAPFLADSLIQKKYGVDGNSTVTLYGFYSDPNHQWSPAAHSRYLREKPDPAEVKARYLHLLFSAEGAEIFSNKCGAVLNDIISLAADRLFLSGLVGLALLGWLIRPAEPVGSATSPARRWGGRLVLGCIGTAAATLFLVEATSARLLAFTLLIGALALHAALTGRRLAVLLTIAFCSGLAFHAALGLNGGQRVIGNYVIFLFAACVAAVAEAPHATAPPCRELRWIAGAVFGLVLLGYTGNFWLRTGFKAQLRAQLAVPQTAVKLSDSPALDRSLYFTGEMGLFYTRFDPLPFGTVRHYTTMIAPNGFGNVTLLEPAVPGWDLPNTAPSSR